VLYLHAGLFDEAAAELGAYLHRATRGGAREDPFDLRLTKLLLEFIESGGQPGGEAGRGGFGSLSSDARGGGSSGSSGGGSPGPAGGGDAPGAKRQTLLAPRAAGSAPALGPAAATEPGGGDASDASSSGGGSSSTRSKRPAPATELMSVEKILAAAEAGAGAAAGGGLLGAARSKLPLTW
jgi:hypothetical protein